MPRLLHLAALLILLIVLIVLGVAPVLAHANLVHSEPAANAGLDRAPAEIRLWFSETPESGFSEIRLLDKQGQAVVGVGALRVDPADAKVLHVTVPDLSRGVYTVTWKVLSSVDGHVTAGGFAFVVGKDQVPEGGLKPTSAVTFPTPELLGVIARWLSFLSMALLVGGFAFVPLVFNPAQRRFARTGAAPVGTPGGSFSHESGLFAVLVGLWALLLAASGLSAIAQTRQIGGTFFALLGNERFGILMALVILLVIVLALRLSRWWRHGWTRWWWIVGAMLGGALLALLGNSRFGLILWLRVVLVILLAEVLALRQSRWWRREWALRWWIGGTGVGLLLLLTISLGSHAAAFNGPTALQIALTAADWTHLIAVSLWVGGLVALLLALRWLARGGTDPSRRMAALLISRFSQIASICVAVVAITGTMQSIAQVVDPANLLDTAYGQTLALKLILLLPILALAGINLNTIQRGQQTLDTGTDTPDWSPLIRRTAVTEVAFVVAILLVTGVLTSLPPARDAFGAGAVARGQAADVRVLVASNPGTPGLNTFDILLRDSLNRPLREVQKVALRFAMPEMGGMESEVVAVAQEDGHYVAQGGNLSMIGSWAVEVIVRREGRDDARVTLPLYITSLRRTVNTPVLTTPLRLVIGLDLIVVAVVLLVGSRRLGKVRQSAGRAAVAVGWIGVLIGIVVGISGFSITSNLGLQNPVPADALSKTRGEIIFRTYCVSCHGPTGAGDGPVGVTLNPRPANLRDHMRKGHTDGELFEWITNGVSGTAMPAFGDKLVEDARWDVINYIRTFAELPTR